MYNEIVKYKLDKVKDNYYGTYEFEYIARDNNVDKVRFIFFNNETTYKEIYVNTTVTINPVILPTSVTNKKLIWKSSNLSIATVSENGEVTGKKSGLVEITATSTDDSSLFSSYSLYVNSQSLTFDEYKINLKVGKKYKIKSYVRGVSNAVNYTSLNNKIATVSKDGLVIAKKVGSTKIKVQAKV